MTRLMMAEARTERRGKKEESRDMREDIMNRTGDSTHGIEASERSEIRENKKERIDRIHERIYHESSG